MTARRSRPRSILASVLAVVLLAGVAGAVSADSTFVPSGVTFKVDDAARTITVTAKLAFYNRSCTPGASCAVPAADISRITRAIESMWNNGSKVRCYTLIVKVEARAVASQAEAGQTEVDIGLDYGPITIRAFVHGQHAGSAPPDHLSNSPEQRVEAAHDPAAPTTWPSQTYDRTYAHEFGHILGLDDNYDTSRPGFPLPGASDDLMFRKQGEVTNEMATRVVERSGKVDVKKLKCGWFTEGTQEKKWVGKHCDEADADWTINAEVSTAGLRTTELYTAVIDPKTHKGTYSYESIGEIAGGTYTQNGKGVVTTAEQSDGTLLMSLSEILVRGVITAGGTTQSVTAPIPATAFTWKPAATAECP